MSSSSIYYEGTEEQWNSIYPYETEALIYFNHTHAFVNYQSGCTYYKECAICDLEVFDYDEHDWWYDHSTEEATYYTCYNCWNEKESNRSCTF